LRRFFFDVNSGQGGFCRKQLKQQCNRQCLSQIQHWVTKKRYSRFLQRRILCRPSHFPRQQLLPNYFLVLLFWNPTTTRTIRNEPSLWSSKTPSVFLVGNNTTLRRKIETWRKNCTAHLRLFSPIWSLQFESIQVLHQRWAQKILPPTNLFSISTHHYCWRQEPNKHSSKQWFFGTNFSW